MIQTGAMNLTLHVVMQLLYTEDLPKTVCTAKRALNDDTFAQNPVGKPVNQSSWMDDLR